MKLILISLVVAIAVSVFVYTKFVQDGENSVQFSSENTTNLVANTVDKKSVPNQKPVINESISSTADNVNYDSTTSDEPIISEDLEERYRTLSDNDQFPTLASRMSVMHNRRPDSNFSPEDILSSMEKEEAWQESNGNLGILSQKLSEEELSDGRQFVDFDPLKVETLMPGDHMDIPVDSIGQVFDMRVDKVKVFKDGNIMWKGTIVNGEGGTVSITQSSEVTLASVILREQDYTLESHGANGWIVDSGVLFKIDPNISDAIIPPGEQHAH